MHMKKFTFIILLSSLNFLYAQTPSSCIIPQQLADGYYRDIRQLATNDLFQTLSPDTDLVTIPQPSIDPIIEGMAAILNSQLPESDSVFNIYCVHNFNGWPYEYEGFLVSIDTNFSWTQAWKNLITITGDPLMDTITSRYGLHITDFYDWSFGTYALLATDSAWNPDALIDTFQLVPGVLSAEQNYILGNAGNITYTDNGTERIYEFYFEFNDCFDGCDNYRKWTFKVYPNCSVDYMGFVDYGIFGVLPLPAPVNCNLYTSLPKTDVNHKQLSIYPNPANDFITIQLPEKINSNFQIMDVNGKIVKQVKITNTLMRLEVSDLPEGVYILKSSDEKNHYSASFTRIRY